MFVCRFHLCFPFPLTEIDAISWILVGLICGLIWDHLRSGIICRPIWGSLAVRDHLQAHTDAVTFASEE